MKGLLGFFVRHRAAANLSMLLLVLVGLGSLGFLRQQKFPDFETGVIVVSVAYPGAGPLDVEEGICVRLEEQLRDLDGVRHLRSVASQGLGQVTLELHEGVAVDRLVADVDSRVRAVEGLPELAEEPVIREIEQFDAVMQILVTADTGEKALHTFGEHMRQEIADLPGVSRVQLEGVRPFEVSIELSEEAMRRHGLTFDQVAMAIRQGSADLPGGTIRAQDGELLLRSPHQARSGEQLEDLLLMAHPDGSRLRLGDVATVIDGFHEVPVSTFVDRTPAVWLRVERGAGEHAGEIAEQVRSYLARIEPTLPAGVSVRLWRDHSDLITDRLRVLIENGLQGLALVLVGLTLFLRLRTAVWVALGIPVAFFGAFAGMLWLDLTIDSLSLFGFLVALGIVVDDAIVVGENISRHEEKGSAPGVAAVDGAYEVWQPVLFSVLTTILAFVPLALIPGNIGQMVRAIPLVVILVLLVSLFECLLILPAHLGHRAPKRWSQGRSKKQGRWSKTRGIGGRRIEKDDAWTGDTWIGRPVVDLAELGGAAGGSTDGGSTDGGPEGPGGAERWLQGGWARGALERVVKRFYLPSLALALRWRYSVLAFGVAVLLIAFGALAGGHVRFAFFPPVEADHVAAILTMPLGTSSERTREALEQLDAAAEALIAELEAEGRNEIRFRIRTLGEQPMRGTLASNTSGLFTRFAGSHLAEVVLELEPVAQRQLGAPEVLQRWRQLTGTVPGAEELSFVFAIFDPGAPIHVRIAGHDLEQLDRASELLRERLGPYPGVFNLADSLRAGRRELEITLRPEGEALGLTQTEIARQVRQAFYGEEVQRFQRGRDDIEVLLRLPERHRSSLEGLHDLRLRTSDGAEVPLPLAADITWGRGLEQIERADGRRTASVTADLDLAVADPRKLNGILAKEILPALRAEVPGVEFTFGGQHEQQQETAARLLTTLGLVLFLTYFLLALPLDSYSEPLVVLSAVPFGLVGAIGGHWLTGQLMTGFSTFGMVALSGVVINDSLVLVDFVHRERRRGKSLGRSVLLAGRARFRPIFLTSITTFLGLLPLLLERSVQAQFLIPMATSIAFGVLFALVVVLFLVPCLLLVVEDVRRRVTGGRGRGDSGRGDSGRGDSGRGDSGRGGRQPRRQPAGDPDLSPGA